MAVIDAFEAMVSGRPYKKGLKFLKAVEELKKNKGTQFDPSIVDAFCHLSKETKFRKYLSMMGA
jgi:HD-GYP domain-containing protein (c-di-GMP phosphodiesterase class II)